VAPYFVRGSSWLFVFIFEELVNYRTRAANRLCDVVVNTQAVCFTISVFFFGELSEKGRVVATNSVASFEAAKARACRHDVPHGGVRFI
jgi:hypothetical protein